MRIEPETFMEKVQRAIGFNNGVALGFGAGLVVAGLLATAIFH